MKKTKNLLNLLTWNKERSKNTAPVIAIIILITLIAIYYSFSSKDKEAEVDSVDYLMDDFNDAQKRKAEFSLSSKEDILNELKDRGFIHESDNRDYIIAACQQLL